MPSSGKGSPNCIRNSEKGNFISSWNDNREDFIDEQTDPEDKIVISRAWGVQTKQGEKCLAKANSFCIGIVEDMARKTVESELKALGKKVWSLSSVSIGQQRSHPSGQYPLSIYYMRALHELFGIL